jgi:hypothetical protein
MNAPSQKLVGDSDQENSNEKRAVNVRVDDVDGTAHLPEMSGWKWLDLLFDKTLELDSR